MNKIKVYRTIKNLSQQELADKLGLHVNYISRIERGELDPSFSNMIKIIKFLGIPLEEFLNEL